MVSAPFENLGDWISNGGSPGTERSLGGLIPAYPVFMFIGIIVVIIASIIKLRMKKIPLAEFEWGILIVVPVGILGGTIFGKMFIPNMIWYHVFFFWEPGMSLFGAIGLGTVAGFVWFYRRSKVTKISVWVYADCILPNVLLGQAIGRWGNLYNHEILGQVVSYDSLSWLIPSIRDKLWYFPQELGQINLPAQWWTLIVDENGIISAAKISEVITDPAQAKILTDLLQKPIEFRQPLFLIESLLNFFWWIILTFVVANLSRFFQKKGKYPWDIQPKAYPGWYNKQYKTLPEQEIISWSTQNPIKYKRVLVKNLDGDEFELKIPFFSAWNKAYYFYEIPSEKRTSLYNLNDELLAKKELNESLLAKTKELHKKNVKKIKQNFTTKTYRLTRNDQKWLELKALKNENLKVEKTNYLEKVRLYRQNLGGIWHQFKPNPISKVLEEFHNPHKFFILRCGVLSGGYVAGYTFYRLILETLRQPQEFFIQNYAVANFTVLALIVLFGWGLILWAQLVSPYKYREVGWLYEKSY